MMKILIVEDNHENLEMLDTFLKSHKYQTYCAINGVEAIGILETTAVDLIISDILMPEMDGYMLCKKVKSDARWADIPFIFYSATFTTRLDEIFAIKLGATKFVRKPMEPSSFLKIIQEILQSRIDGTLETAQYKFKDDQDVSRVYNQRIVKKLEEKVSELEKSELKLSNAMKIAKLGYWDYNVDEDMFTFDDHFYAIFHTTAEKMGGYQIKPQQYAEQFLHPDDREIVANEMHKALETEDPNFSCQLEHRIIYADGGTGYITVRYFTEKDNQGRTIRTFGANQDITDRKRMEAEKRVLENQLLQSQKMEAIGNLAGGVAHDFNNLLTIIQGHAQMLMMKYSENDPDYNDLQQIVNASSRAANLTRQLLLFSRKQAMEFKPIKLNDTISNLLKMLKRLIGENINIVTTLEKSPWTIEADEGNLEQVIVNLSVNARDAMQAGGTLTIQTENLDFTEEDCQSIQYAKAGKFLRLSITDTGYGIPAELLEKVFDPFFTTKEVDKGTGLGLSVVYGIVKKHNGWVNVSSEIDRGTVFNLYFPKSDKTILEEIDKTDSKYTYQGNGEKILVIEDEAEVLKFTSAMLRQNGYIPITALNATQALEQFKSEKGQIDLIISDVVLPDKNGLQIVEEILSKQADIPAIFCSGYTEEEIMELIKTNKKYRYIQKPYPIKMLLSEIYSALKEHGQT